MKARFFSISMLSALLLVFTQLPEQAFSYSYGFYNISANNAVNAATGEAQLSVDVTDYGSNQVLFTFLNAGPQASSITDVYFDDGTLFDNLAGLIDADQNNGDPGVKFTQWAKPKNLPAANNASPPFETTKGFSADSDSSVQPNGVNPGESLGVIFGLLAGKDLSDTIAALGTGALRIGIHVQGFANGGSESFVNNPPAQAVPEPAIMLLLGSSLIGLAGFRRRQKR
ncbi:MAG: PEP-CTERM sorting domain-containing protein [Desulfobacterales bacterium]|nr:PEP-CTERM sorting domain-containing protein [Desulfobacterales bacterium]